MKNQHVIDVFLADRDIHCDVTLSDRDVYSNVTIYNLPFWRYANVDFNINARVIVVANRVHRTAPDLCCDTGLLIDRDLITKTKYVREGLALEFNQDVTATRIPTIHQLYINDDLQVEVKPIRYMPTGDIILGVGSGHDADAQALFFVAAIDHAVGSDHEADVLKLVLVDSLEHPIGFDSESESDDMSVYKKALLSEISDLTLTGINDEQLQTLYWTEK